MPEENTSGKSDIWVSVVIVVRVILMMVIWIALFLAIFLGYFTFPLFLIGLLTLIYALSDLGIFVAWRKRRQRAIEPDPESSGEDKEEPLNGGK